MRRLARRSPTRPARRQLAERAELAGRWPALVLCLCHVLGVALPFVHAADVLDHAAHGDTCEAIQLVSTCCSSSGPCTDPAHRDPHHDHEQCPVCGKGVSPAHRAPHGPRVARLAETLHLVVAERAVPIDGLAPRAPSARDPPRC